VLRLAASASVRGDHLDAVLFGKLLVEFVRVVSFVADEPSREFAFWSGDSLFRHEAKIIAK
jgi:hypothetical protein